MTVVNATAGRDLGTRPSRRMRAEGQLPGVIYGEGITPQPVQVTYNELRDALKGPAGLNTVFTLNIDGVENQVIVRDIQRDPIRRTVRHADFMRVTDGTKVKLTIPIVLTGRAVKVLDNGGIIEQKRHELKVLVGPMHIPHQIEVDVSHMDLDHRISVADLDLPTGVESLIDPGITVAATVVPRGLKSDLDEDELLDEDGEPIVAADGEDGEASADGDGGSSESQE